MKINFNKELEFALSIDKEYTPNLSGFMNLSASFNGDYETQLAPSAIVNTYSVLTNGRKFEEKDGFSLTYDVYKKDVNLSTFVKTFDGINAVEQYSKVTCNSGKERLTSLCSGCVLGVCYDDGENLLDRLSDGSIVIHYCLSKWQSEGQWRKATPEDLGLFPATIHEWETCRFRIDSISTWSTGTYYPIFIIEDKKKNQSWFFESFCSFNWFMEILLVGGQRNAKSFTVKLGGMGEKLGFNVSLEGGKSLVSPKCVYGLVNGGFDSAVKELIKYKRETALVKGMIPLVFNDYMNCNWGIQTKERLYPLIDRASEIGAEIFCLDDGWHTGFGFWEPNDAKFGEGGLQSVIDYIHSKGLKAGVWFEFESAKEEIVNLLGEEALLHRNGDRVAPYRPLANFRCEKFVNHLYKAVDKIYSMGVRYIKNDHNNTANIGIDDFNESAGFGLYQNHLAFLEFIDGLRKKYPDLIIENCGSGAMREDWGTLSHFAVQSTSDQEDYVYYTSIASGSLAYLPCEKAGIWAYPYPQPFDDRELSTLSDSSINSYKDGEQTVYNLVNGMSGCMYMSGRVDLMDEKNLSLLTSGVNLFKSIRQELETAYPVYPMGMIRLGYKGVYAFGQQTDNAIYLYAFNTSDNPAMKSIDVSDYKMENCELIFSAKNYAFNYELKNEKLTVEFSNPKSAVILKLTK